MTFSHVNVSVFFAFSIFASLASTSGVWAAECSGKPNALGTSRTITLDPKEHAQIGRMMYRETLPLNDHEVVLTFDDGPLPRYTNLILDELAAECVKATFFIVGQMANEFPKLVQRAQAEGHTIGTHTQNHLLKLSKLPLDEAKKEITDGISSTATALGDANLHLPFLRLPGLRFSPAIEEFTASEGMVIWSSDIVADDWRRISAKQVLARALDRLEKRGRGILLLHDIHQRTVTALPKLLQELKLRHYSIVHVVAADAEHPKTATIPEEWLR